MKKATLAAVREHIEAGWRELQHELQREARRPMPGAAKHRKTTATTGEY